MDEQPRQLRPVLDYPEWPHQKWNRARQLTSELDARIRAWAVTVPAGLEPVFSSDRRVVTFIARIPHEPPTFEWSLILADALHNYRTALDALAWAMAHLDGAAPPAEHARRLYFPICTTRKQWDDQVKGPLSSVPEEILDRLHSIQPYPFPPVEDGIFVHLHELDIADKHKGLLQASVRMREPHQIRFRMKLEGDIPWEQAVDGDGWEWVIGDGPIRDRDPVLRMKATIPIDSAECPMRVPVMIAVTNRGRPMDVMHMLTLIDQQVDATFQIVETGFYDDGDGEDASVPSEREGPSANPSENPSNHATPG